jgi:hypothetical protein
MNWPVLFDALKTFSIVGFLGYGITLLKQQNELLERDKSLKESEINLHKAEVAPLRTSLRGLWRSGSLAFIPKSGVKLTVFSQSCRKNGLLLP